MEIRVDENQLPIVVTARGALSGAGRQAFESTVMPLVSTVTEPRRDVVVDLSGVTRVDSEGLGTMVSLTCRANVNKVRLVFARPTMFVSEVIRLTKLHQFLNVVDEMPGASAPAN